ncbi:MAG: hypothetical protein MUE94_08290 [Verrucomicrobia bacterium]|nr:hypothetical protein [Verrucomicrobiota bacterium]
MRGNRQQGVALVVTLILLAVITFTAITFLVVSRSEKGAVATSTDQTIAQLAADTGLDRVQAEILSSITATSNRFGYNLKVTTNYINPLGFDPGLPGGLNLNPPFERLTNVAYTDLSGNPLSAADQQQNIANLFYSPRPPVYIFTNRAQTGTPDFRFYLDLNRNGQFEPSGRQPVVGQSGNYLNTNGLDSGIPFLTQPPPSDTLSNSVTGDPEWIGILERPDEPHGPDNRFVARYATVVVPAGKTLDLNRVHNQADANYGDWRDYRRNMGVGTWEINLAAFLVDLNTNVWIAQDDPVRVNPYIYDPPYSPNPRILGIAFEDANALIRYRYDTSFNSLRSVDELLGAGVVLFRNDLIDGYGSGPFLTGAWALGTDPDDGRTAREWPGDDNPRHYFSPGDLFDQSKVGADFVNRLRNIGSPPNQSTYDRYTFYRLLSQLGTDGGLERRDKVNLNYDNKVQQNAAGIVSATNFYAWRPVDFFIEAADNLLREYHGAHFRTVFGNAYVQDNNLAVNIPVVTNGVFVYTPSINRLLQLAANLYDATTNRSGNGAINFPTVFRPIVGPAPNANYPAGIYILGWEEMTEANAQAAWQRKPLDMFNPSEAGLIKPGENVYGVPWIIGAKQGLPNFNELAVDNLFEVTRKLEIRKPTLASQPNETNQMYLFSVNSAVGVEAWNSYRTNFPGTVDVYATNEIDVYIIASNSPSALPPVVQAYRSTFGSARTPTPWVGTGTGELPAKQSFLAAIATNFTIITNSIFRADNRFETRLSPGFDRTSANRFPLPEMRLAFTNRLQVVMVDRASKRVLDYVHLRMGTETNLTTMIADLPGSVGYDGMYVTNRVGGNEFDISAPPLGVIHQIEASLGNYGTPGNVWRDFGFGQAAGQTADKEIDKFASFMLGRSSAYPPYRKSTNLVMQVPFSPSKRIQQTMNWQANDPLVHYTAGDLAQLSIGSGVQPLVLSQTPKTLSNIGRVNDRYQPWGGNPDSSAQTGATGRRNYDPRFKDPLVRRSDDWQFPTNKLPSVGWLGRVHRGTPWQTIYMKSGRIPRSPRAGGAGREWREWTGNNNREDSELTFPQEDWRLFDLFTAAFNDNATAGQLSVNQDGLAAWSAVLSGVIALTNSTSDADLPKNTFYVPVANPYVIEPAGVAGTNSVVGRIVAGINAERKRKTDRGFVHPYGAFQNLGEVFATAELSVDSPVLNVRTNFAAYVGDAELQNPESARADTQRLRGITDVMYERIPQQIAGLLRGDDPPRFEIYSYGQALKPAERSLVTSGPFFGLCTNYQVMAEAATRTVVRVEGVDAEPFQPRVVVESFNVLPPD